MDYSCFLYVPIKILPYYTVNIFGGIREMDEDLKQQLEWLNANLNTVAQNQAMLYAELKEIEGRLPEQEAEG